MFKYNDFVTCVDPEGVLKEFGLNDGDTLFIIGDGFVPLEGEYNFRQVFVVFKVENDHIVTTEKPWSIDPLKIKHVSEEEQDRLTKVFHEDYAPKQGTVGEPEAVEAVSKS